MNTTQPQDLRVSTTLRRTSFWTVVLSLAATVLIVGLFTACHRAAPSASTGNGANDRPWFEDVTARSNVDFEHTSGHDGHYWFPEISTGGVGLLDYDGDGYLDLYFVQGGSLGPSGTAGPGNKLYRNRGDWTFEDVTEIAGVGDAGYGMGCTAGDYDEDGDVDLYVTNVGQNVLYRNNGDGTFTDVTAQAGVGDDGWGSSCTFLDYDRDGYVDLFVANYINWSPGQELECYSRVGRRDYCSPKNYNASARDTMYRNLGDGTFEDATASSHMSQAFGNGFGIACADYNGDGHLDFYVANDGTANQLWMSDGSGRFTDEALISGCALNHYGWAEAGMGVAAVDIENDGDFDLFMSHLHEETNTFYLNRNGKFEDATSIMGLAAPSLGFTGFGLGFADFDHDGSVDLYVANGRVKFAEPRYDPDDPYAEPNLLFRGSETGQFHEVLPRGGTSTLLAATSRAAAFGDLDNDGDIDIVVVNKDGRPHLLSNIIDSPNNWIMFRALNRRGGDAVGATVRIDVADRIQWRIVQRTYSYCASNDPRIHYGLGPAQQVDAVTVRWPGGREESFGSFAAGQIYELRERATQ